MSLIKHRRECLCGQCVPTCPSCLFQPECDGEPLPWECSKCGAEGETYVQVKKGSK